jgi:hypothetical protein
MSSQSLYVFNKHYFSIIEYQFKHLFKQKKVLLLLTWSHTLSNPTLNCHNFDLNFHNIIDYRILSYVIFEIVCIKPNNFHFFFDLILGLFSLKTYSSYCSLLNLNFKEKKPQLFL